MLSRRDFGRGVAASVGAASVMSCGAASAASEPMASLNVICPNQGARFDAAYYRITHIPLAMKVTEASRSS